MDFWGFRRADGRVGVRNHVLILPTVGCACEVCARIAAQVHGAVSFVNPNGCGETEQNLRYTRDVLTGMASHPNVYGVICVGIGCELNTMDGMLERLGRLSKPVEGFTIQEAGGSVGAIARGCTHGQRDGRGRLRTAAGAGARIGAPAGAGVRRLGTPRPALPPIPF